MNVEFDHVEAYLKGSGIILPLALYLFILVALDQ